MCDMSSITPLCRWLRALLSCHFALRVVSASKQKFSGQFILHSDFIQQSCRQKTKSRISIISGLEVTVSIEVGVSILFGLKVNVETVLSYLVEVFMGNSFVFLACVWCGVAFLRA